MASDLSLAHQPVTDLFPAPRSEAEWAPYRITEEQVAQFHRDGFLPGVRMLDQRQLDVLRSELAELTQADHDGSDLWYEYHSNESDDPGAGFRLNPFGENSRAKSPARLKLLIFGSSEIRPSGLETGSVA